MKKYDYDVVVIGAGSAGLAAVKQLQKMQARLLLIDQGPLGTTCARVGCMPSKAFLQFAFDYKKARDLHTHGLIDDLRPLNRTRFMERVRHHRDHFVGYILRDMDRLQDSFMQGHASFVDPHTIRIDGKRTVSTKATIIATGSEPVIPAEFRPFEKHLVTTDQIFEATDIPNRWAIAGLGPIGLEIGQALAWIGAEVIGFDMAPHLGSLRDPAVHASAVKGLQKDMTIHLETKISLAEQSGKIQVLHGQQRQTFDKVLMAVGRRPRLSQLDIKNTGCTLNKKGQPPLDEHHMIPGLPIYLAGDVDAKAPILHEAAIDGKYAACHAMGKEPGEKNPLRLGIVFGQPNLGSVGLSYDKLGDAVTGEARFEDQGRSKIMGLNEGCLHVYVDRRAGTILGAELAAPAGEHLLHLLGSFIQQKMTVRDALNLPFYHPTVEEGLRTALKHAGGLLAKS